MELATHLAHLDNDGVLLANAADSAGLDTAVPTCPDWSVRDLLQHIGRVHRWAASFVRDARTSPPKGDQELAAPPGDESLLDWYREGHADLVQVLSNAPADVGCWSFLPAPSPLQFWARRQAHETAIHRVDAERAAGAVTGIDPALAVDGIDELLRGFFARSGGRLVADPPVRLGLRATDAPDAWTVTIGTDGHEVADGLSDADCIVAAKAAELYTLLWNRRDADGLSIDGDAGVLALWQENAKISWS